RCARGKIPQRAPHAGTMIGSGAPEGPEHESRGEGEVAMASRGTAGWLGVVLGCLAAAPAWAGPEPVALTSAPMAFPAARGPAEELAPGVRERVARLLEQPTLSARGPAEAFYCRPAVYYWLLDHPDLGVRMWRLLGAQCTDISNEGEGRFGWHDPQAGDL